MPTLENFKKVSDDIRDRAQTAFDCKEYNEAITITSDEINKLQDSSCQAAEPLDFKASAEEHSRTVDFVTEFPQELLVQILESFSTEELVALALVSLSWYNKITRCIPLWRHVTFSMGNKDAWLVIPSIGQHVWDAACVSGSQWIWEEDLGGAQKSFEEQTLRYCKSVENDYHGRINTSYMKYYLGPSWHLDSVFTAFPNIKHLEFDGGSRAVHCDGSTLTPPLMHLTTLRLTMPKTQQPEHVEMILRRCPSLRRLSISDCYWSMTKVFEQLETLEVLVFHHYLSGSGTMTLHRRLMSSAYTEKDPPKGLRSLVLVTGSKDSATSRPWSCSCDITGLIVQNSGTLEELIIGCVKDFNYYGNYYYLYRELTRRIRWNRIFAAQFQNLQRLYCIIPDSRRNAFIAMLRRCTGLIDCGLAHPLLIDGDMLNALVTMKRLRRLELTFGGYGHGPRGVEPNPQFGEFSGIPGISITSLYNLLRRSTARLNGLQHICFKDCTVISFDIFNVLAQTRIRGIEFSNNTHLEYEDIREYIPKLDMLPSLEWVLFDSVTCAGDDQDYEVNDIWVLGERHELVSLHLQQLSQCPSLPGEDRFIALLNRQKHKKLINELRAAEGVSSADSPTTRSLVYTFLQKELGF